MALTRVVWHPAALHDLDGIATYLDERDPRAARRLVARIIQSAGTLERHPHAGRIGRVDRTRELVIAASPYIVAYTVDDEAEEIRILAVFHGRRRWPDAFGRD